MSALGHPVLETPTLDALARRGVLFANHWANAAPCGPSRACLYTGTYQHRNRSILNGTPLDARFTNVALLAREAGYDPVLFGYTDTSVDPRTVPVGDPRLFSYEGVLPGFRAVIEDPWEKGSPGLGALVGGTRRRCPGQPPRPVRADRGLPGCRSPRCDLGAGALPRRALPDELRAPVGGRVAGAERRRALLRPCLLHPPPSAAAEPGRATTTSMTPRRWHRSSAAPPGKRKGRSIHSVPSRWARAQVGAPQDERDRRQVRATYYGAQREVDDGLAPLFEYLVQSGLAESTLVVLTSDHGEMGGDHWLLEKLGFWDESYHVPLIVVDPRSVADGGAGDHRRRGDRVGGRAADHLRLHGRGRARAGRRLVAPSVPPGRAGARALARHGALRVELLGSRSTCWPRTPSASR